MMDALKRSWQVWSMRLDALSFRERVLVFVAVGGVALSLMFVGLIEPALKQQELMLQNASALQQEALSLREQLLSGEQLNQSGRNTELGRLHAEADALAQQVKARESGLVSPTRMIEALRTLLDAQPGLTLLTLETEPGEPAVDPAAAQPAAGAAAAPETPAPAGPVLYKHRVTVRVQGSYAQLTDYVARLEALPWTVQWESVALDAHRHPRLELTLKLNTLSRESTWARL